MEYGIEASFYVYLFVVNILRGFSKIKQRAAGGLTPACRPAKI
jgi:hypothetical protein